MNRTSIEWTHRPGTVGMTWNPVRARLKGASEKARTGTFCTKVSPGCTHCYASIINKRFGTGLEFTVPNLFEHEFVLPDRFLQEPLQQKKPCTIFVGDMFDLFHEAIPVEYIAEVLRVALKTPRHTFQFLTKRAERMQRTVNFAQEHWGVEFDSHMWFGVSVEDKERALERIPRLQETRCAVRFLSVEPMLEAIELGHDTPEVGWISYLTGFDGCDPDIPGVDWVICGGESGPGARPFNLAWAESLLEQCRGAHVPFFLKQIGAQPRSAGGAPYTFHDFRNDRKGGDPAEWPEHLRVREFPSQKVEAVSA